ncbi:NAD-dependent dehydratase [Sphingopyxis lindanitolerans]|uniref:NAD-dependent dehydratase n=1 Tax=Sphingopyxis lindanitolerans TaxID=2054227 RepID=A0A2S8B2E5_9SPHN|nr:NAD-dependent dehydratase [Sphingopyxis lindanitolerans]PQM26581.1 NAD-dependent dehydratase [Sphingopyxis lindanitolerans]
MTSPDILLLGATGLVGGIVARLVGPAILVRRAPDDPPPQQKMLVAPGGEWPALIADNRPSTLISCLGTTIRQAGSQAAFRAVDHDLVLAAARAARGGGARHMITVSSVGASAKSRNFYLRTKGEVEEGLRTLRFDRLDIIRPGLLTGDRPGTPRLGEGIAMVAAPLTDALLHGSLRRYRSIPAETVAKAIARLTRCEAPGAYIHENDAIRTLAD